MKNYCIVQNYILIYCQCIQIQYISEMPAPYITYTPLTFPVESGRIDLAAAAAFQLQLIVSGGFAAILLLACCF